jgi:urease accessory protein
MINNARLLHLLHLSDPALPVGGFSHSAGLETYVQHGLVKDKQTAEAFITAMLSQSIRYNDAAFVSLCMDACAAGNVNAVMELDRECMAAKLPTEMRQASKKMGTRLLKIFEPLLSVGCVKLYNEAVGAQNAPGNYCIAFGVVADALAIPQQDALRGFYYNAAAGLVTNCVKLVPLGQQTGQEIMFSLMPLMETLAAATPDTDPAMLGLCCTGFDIRSMQHEQLYSRLYMS